MYPVVRQLSCRIHTISHESSVTFLARHSRCTARQHNRFFGSKSSGQYRNKSARFGRHQRLGPRRQKKLEKELDDFAKEKKENKEWISEATADKVVTVNAIAVSLGLLALAVKFISMYDEDSEENLKRTSNEQLQDTIEKFEAVE